MDKWLTHPTSLKIISVAVAVLLWAVVHYDPNTSPQTVSNVENKIIEAAIITTTGLDPEKYLLTAMEPSVVRLDVQGRLTDLMRASSVEDYVVKVDLSNAKIGIQELPLSYNMPKGIQLNNISPRTVTVHIEELVTQTFVPEIVVSGQPAEGYITGDATLVAPVEGVEITLPRDDMDRVSLVTAEININGSDKTVVDKKAKIMIYNDEGMEITNAALSQDTVHVEVRVTPPFKTLPLQTRYTGSLPAHLSLVSIRPEIREITVYGARSALDRLQVYEGVILDLSKVKESGSVEVKAQLMEGIKYTEPVMITLNVTVAPIISQTMEELPIRIDGVGGGLTAAFQSPEDGRMELTVRGAQSVISGLVASDIRVTANVEGLLPGVHAVPLQVDVPAFVEIEYSEGQILTAMIEIEDPAAVIDVPEDAEEVDAVPVTDEDTEKDDETNNPANTGAMEAEIKVNDSSTSA